MRAPWARRLAVASAAGILLAGGAAVGTAGTASAAVPAVHNDVNTNRCFVDHDDWRCFDHHGFRFNHRRFCFDHPRACFDHHFGNRVVVIIVMR
ncbi:hypothetical protein ABZV75_10075 [Streptomyces flaveolus]|uniref:hypothetical protein n=1 Tax=Streptomyces flaveolus TaxID=67297 RepID=UPI0033BD68A2